MKKILSTFVLFVSASVLLAQTQIQTPMPAQTSSFTGNVRGYWFIAPTCFTITGAEVPTDAGTGNQSIAIVRLQANPPLYSTTTDAFDTLFLTQNNPFSGIFPMNIIINQGDIIGVLGCRGTVTSYSSTGNVTTIDGISTTLNRFGMQYPLATTPPQQLWTEAGGNIGRVYLYYDTNMVYNMGINNIGADYTFSDGTDTLYTSLFSVWNYGDGSPLDTNYNPTHTYPSNGTYNVCSYVNTSCGIDTVCTSINVCYYTAVAGFTINTMGATSTFTDASTNATSWSWDFGDGNTDNVQNPVHGYTSDGWFTVTQIAANSCGLNDTIIDSVFICLPVTAGYSYSGETTGSVQFTDISSNGEFWSWDFGDGNTDNLQNPLHTYAANGWYNITQIVSRACGSADTIVDSILVCVPVVANFSFSGESSGNVTFTDGSTTPDTWAWDFGDGGSSTLQNPGHNYPANGSYNVCLISSDICSADTICLLVTACPSDPTAGFTSLSAVFDANFTNTSTLSTTYYWDFGDGNTSTLINPNHTYAIAGSYNVCLTSYDECGDSSVSCNMVTILGNVGIEELSEIQTMIIFPNPSQGQTSLNLNCPVNIEGKIYITDITGKIVQSIYAGEFIKGETTYPVNTSTWSNGIYMVVWETNNWKISKKLLVN